MKLQKFLIAGLLVTAFSGLSAGASQALSCAGGFEPKDGDSMTECVAIEPVEATAYTAEDGEAVDPEPTLYTEETPAVGENGCWTQTDADGNSVDVCARGVVAPTPTLYSGETPAVGENGCWTQTDADGNSVDVCAKEIVPISLEVDTTGCGVVTDENGVDTQVCADGVPTDPAVMYQTGVPEMRNDVELTSAGGSNGSDSSSNTLAALGVLIAAAGAFGIGLSRQRAAKK
ncbi:MAG: hypothetical protein EBZ87_02800 [Microbacteriaceae bacterium]|nr:hypothetical protein [Microbacteriaceae bacterium]